MKRARVDPWTALTTARTTHGLFVPEATRCAIPGCAKTPDPYRADTPAELRELCFRHRSVVKNKARDLGVTLAVALQRTGSFQERSPHACSRCGGSGHNARTCGDAS